MLDMTFPFKLPPLPYAYDALEPYIDAETMHYHHDGHFRTYINNLNNALAPYPRLHNLTLEKLLSGKYPLPNKEEITILRNAGGVYNHTLYFDGLSPHGGHEPRGKFLSLINNNFGSFNAFRAKFNEQAASVFGSGYTALVISGNNALRIVNIKNQDTTLPRKPILLVDVWEHAYYLKYKNLRKEYLENIWNVLVMPELPQ